MQRFDQVSPIPPLTRSVKAIIITCVAMFFVDLLFTQFQIHIFGAKLIDILGLKPSAVLNHFWVWQFVTYMFMHGNELHLLLNMLILWYFGSEIEMRLGEKGFWQYFFVCGIGAGLLNLTANILIGDPNKMNSAMIGASGAIYGLLIAYGIFFANRYMLVFFLFPVQARYFALIMAGLEFIFSLKSSPQDNIAHVAHLGGMIVGGLYIYFRYMGSGGRRGKNDREREKLKRQFTLIVNQSHGGGDDDKEDKGPYWN